jgi:hypothetical protein
MNEKIKFNILFGVLLVLSSFVVQPAFAQEAENGDPGITPDSFLYGLDVALDKINLLLTFDQTEKSKKGLEIAQERLLEVRAMALENKISAMERAANEHDNTLAQVESSVQELEKGNTTTELEEEIEIERKLIEHRKRVENVQGELKIKIAVKGGITPEQRELVDSILSNMENKTGKVEIEIDNKKGETKIKIKTETGKSDDEIEEEVERLEEAKGVTGLKRERAEDRIEDAIEKIEEARGLLGNESSKLLGETEEHLSKAQSAFNEEDYGEAFGQATAALKIAKAVEKQQEEESEDEGENKLEIEVEIVDGKAEIEIEMEGEEIKFTLNTTDDEAIIAAISEMTGLTEQEIKKVIKRSLSLGRQEKDGKTVLGKVVDEEETEEEDHEELESAEDEAEESEEVKHEEEAEEEDHEELVSAEDEAEESEEVKHEEEAQEEPEEEHELIEEHVNATGTTDAPTDEESPSINQTATNAGGEGPEEHTNTTEDTTSQEATNTTGEIPEERTNITDDTSITNKSATNTTSE